MKPEATTLRHGAHWPPQNSIQDRETKFLLSGFQHIRLETHERKTT